MSRPGLVTMSMNATHEDDFDVDDVTDASEGVGVVVIVVDVDATAVAAMYAPTNNTTSLIITVPRWNRMQLSETFIFLDEAEAVAIVVSEVGTGNNAKHSSSSHDDDADVDDPSPPYFNNEEVIKLLLNAYSKNANSGG